MRGNRAFLQGWSSFEGGGDVTQFRDQSVGFGDSGEAVVLVEAGCGFVDRIDHDESCGDCLGRDCDATHRVREQGTAETVAVQCVVKRKAREQNRGYLAWSSAAECGGQLVALQEVGGDRVVRHYTVIGLVPHKRPGGSPLLRRCCVLCQPAIKLRLAAIKAREIVNLAERLGAESLWRYCCTAPRARVLARFSAAFALGGSSRTEIRRSKKSAGTTVTTS